MKEFVLDFISQLEGYKTRIKELHWGEDSLPGHELAGDIEEMICDFEDSIAEDLQGVFGEDIKAKELHPYKIDSNTLEEFIDSLKSSTMLFYKKLDGDDYIGSRSEVEGFIHDINVKKYLVNKTTNKKNGNMKQEVSESKLIDILSENLTKEFSKKNTKKELSESKLVDMLAESIMPEYSSDEANGKLGDVRQEAMRIWSENNLSGDIDWEESDWVSSGDETYGPCGGFVECDGWEFEVPGQQEGSEFYIDDDEPIEFTSPNGETGEFYTKDIVG